MAPEHTQNQLERDLDSLEILLETASRRADSPYNRSARELIEKYLEKTRVQLAALHNPRVNHRMRRLSTQVQQARDLWELERARAAL